MSWQNWNNEGGDWNADGANDWTNEEWNDEDGGGAAGNWGDDQTADVWGGADWDQSGWQRSQSSSNQYAGGWAGKGGASAGKNGGYPGKQAAGDKGKAKGGPTKASSKNTYKGTTGKIGKKGGKNFGKTKGASKGMKSGGAAGNIVWQNPDLASGPGFAPRASPPLQPNRRPTPPPWQSPPRPPAAGQEKPKNGLAQRAAPPKPPVATNPARNPEHRGAPAAPAPAFQSTRQAIFVVAPPPPKPRANTGAQWTGAAWMPTVPVSAAASSKVGSLDAMCSSKEMEQRTVSNSVAQLELMDGGRELCDRGRRWISLLIFRRRLQELLVHPTALTKFLPYFSLNVKILQRSPITSTVFLYFMSSVRGPPSSGQGPHPERMIKQYQRSSADRVYDSADIRTFAALEQSASYLWTTILDADLGAKPQLGNRFYKQSDVYNFLRNRCRGIRVDYQCQQPLAFFDRGSALFHEQNLRFELLFLLLMVREDNPEKISGMGESMFRDAISQTSDPLSNTYLRWLEQMPLDEASPWKQMPFIVRVMVCWLCWDATKTAQFSQKFPDELLAHPLVDFALSACAAFQAKDFSRFLAHYYRNADLITAIALSQCANYARMMVLLQDLKSFRPSNETERRPKPERRSLEKLAYLLCLPDAASTETFVREFGLHADRDDMVLYPVGLKSTDGGPPYFDLRDKNGTPLLQLPDHDALGAEKLNNNFIQRLLPYLTRSARPAQGEWRNDIKFPRRQDAWTLHKLKEAFAAGYTRKDIVLGVLDAQADAAELAAAVGIGGAIPMGVRMARSNSVLSAALGGGRVTAGSIRGDASVRATPRLGFAEAGRIPSTVSVAGSLNQLALNQLGGGKAVVDDDAMSMESVSGPVDEGGEVSRQASPEGPQPPQAVLGRSPPAAAGGPTAGSGAGQAGGIFGAPPAGGILVGAGGIFIKSSNVFKNPGAPAIPAAPTIFKEAPSGIFGTGGTVVPAGKTSGIFATGGAPASSIFAPPVAPLFGAPPAGAGGPPASSLQRGVSVRSEDVLSAVPSEDEAKGRARLGVKFAELSEEVQKKVMDLARRTRRHRLRATFAQWKENVFVQKENRQRRVHRREHGLGAILAKKRKGTSDWSGAPPPWNESAGWIMEPEERRRSSHANSFRSQSSRGANPPSSPGARPAKRARRGGLANETWLPAQLRILRSPPAKDAPTQTKIAHLLWLRNHTQELAVQTDYFLEKKEILQNGANSAPERSLADLMLGGPSSPPASEDAAPLHLHEVSLREESAAPVGPKEEVPQFRISLPPAPIAPKKTSHRRCLILAPSDEENYAIGNAVKWALLAAGNTVNEDPEKLKNLSWFATVPYAHYRKAKKQADEEPEGEDAAWKNFDDSMSISSAGGGPLSPQPRPDRYHVQCVFRTAKWYQRASAMVVRRRKDTTGLVAGGNLASLAVGGGASPPSLFGGSTTAKEDAGLGPASFIGLVLPHVFDPAMVAMAGEHMALPAELAVQAAEVITSSGAQRLVFFFVVAFSKTGMPGAAFNDGDDVDMSGMGDHQPRSSFPSSRGGARVSASAASRGRGGPRDADHRGGLPSLLEDGLQTTRERHEEIIQQVKNRLKQVVYDKLWRLINSHDYKLQKKSRLQSMLEQGAVDVACCGVFADSKVQICPESFSEAMLNGVAQQEAVARSEQERIEFIQKTMAIHGTAIPPAGTTMFHTLFPEPFKISLRQWMFSEFQFMVLRARGGGVFPPDPPGTRASNGALYFPYNNDWVRLCWKEALKAIYMRANAMGRVGICC